MHRPVSPALSETEVDISRSLFQDGSPDDSDSEIELDRNKGPPPSTIDLRNVDTEDEDEAFIATAQAAANRKNAAKTAKKASAFQAMGLNANLLKAISRKGFTSPTDIQKNAIPAILDGQDVVGMARTGSGKTAAFVIPMIEKLKSHSVKVGARAIVLSPTRELALQTLKVVKDFSKGTDLRAVLLVGGESLEDQFSSMASNPDIIIATPGRFEHLKVEMRLELSSVKYVVFDEADRLFEMGFAAQLTEILHSLPSSRQTLLFSATLPKSLVEFVRAGLQDPKFERLDAEGKIPPGLESAFFTVKRSEKEGALLHILQDVIQVPFGANDLATNSKTQPSSSSNKKRKRGAAGPAAGNAPSPKSTIVFAATKYHVEYLVSLLKASGYAASYVYSSLDQTARQAQVHDFATGVTNIFVVTDLAARGLDISALANVVNYDFPPQPKAFVHRVGRTARAGKAGWSYNLVTEDDMPYLIDLQLFLSRKLILGRADKEDGMFKDAIVVGNMSRDKLDVCVEEVAKFLNSDEDLMALKNVAARGEQQYARGRNSASSESVKRAKQITRSDGSKKVNMLFNEDDVDGEQERMAMLSRVSGFRPQETVFEIGRKGATSEAANIVKKRRAKMDLKESAKSSGEAESERKASQNTHTEANGLPGGLDVDSDDELMLTRPGVDGSGNSEDELELTVTAPVNVKTKDGVQGTWQDTEHFMGYTPTGVNLSEDRGFGVHSGSKSNFMEAAKGATMDLANDETKAFAEPSRTKGLRWDKKSKKYVSRANDEDGSKGRKTMTSESGQKIAASFRSGRFDAWRKANKVDRLPGVGELERKGGQFPTSGGPRYKHKMERAPKEADKYRDDYHKRKKRVDEAKEKRIGRFAEGRGKSELKGVDHVRKARKVKSQRREKNARPSRKA